MGGVFTGSDVADLVSVGASAVALGTVLFADPWAPARIRSEFQAERVGPVANREAVGHQSAS